MRWRSISTPNPTRLGEAPNPSPNDASVMQNAHSEEALHLLYSNLHNNRSSAKNQAPELDQ